VAQFSALSRHNKTLDSLCPRRNLKDSLLEESEIRSVTRFVSVSSPNRKFYRNMLINFRNDTSCMFFSYVYRVCSMAICR
jgi:hypothetical protein